MANINGVNPPILNDQDYVSKIKDSFDAIDLHDHTTGKGVPIGTTSLADASVTAAKLASNSVTTIKIVDGAVTPAKIASGTAHAIRLNDAAGTLSSLGPLTNGQMLIGSTGAAASVATLTGTASQIVVAPGAGSITLSTPQDIATTSNVQFGSAVVGVGSKAASAVLEGISTTQGFLPPRMTTAQRDAIASPATGLVVFNATNNQLNVYNGVSWGAVGGGTYVANFTGTTITATNDPTQVWRYTGASAQTITAITNAALGDGALIEITGTSNANTISISDSDVGGGWIVNGGWVGSQYSKLVLRWDVTFNRFIEVSRNGL